MNPGAAQLAGEWPAPWAVIPRWLVFLGTSIAAGGFVWVRLLASSAGGSTPGSPVRTGTMALGALVAILATALLPVSQPAPFPGRYTPYRRWRNRSGRCRSAGGFSSRRSLSWPSSVSGSWPAAGHHPPAGGLLWVGLGSGLAALVGLSLTDYALAVPRSPGLSLTPVASPLDPGILALAIAHQSSTALWLSGLLYFAAGWREISSDVARFRRVRWMGGAVLGSRSSLV